MADEEDINRSCIVFVVDTEHYSGNFERPLVSYLTMWDADQDNDYICCNKNGNELYEDDPSYVSSVGTPWPCWFSDDDITPSILFFTPGKDMMGSVGVCFDKLTKEQIVILTERAKEFCDKEKIPMTGVRCFKRKVRKAKDEAYDGD